MRVRFFSLLWIAIAAIFGLCGGCMGEAVRLGLPAPVDYPFLAERAPMPHQVPAHAGGTPFRFAMAHDAIHERYPKHGLAWHRVRERLIRQQLTDAIPDSPNWFALHDDLAAALERLERTDEAIDLMRKKLARQQTIGDSELYTSYANLGTLLIKQNSTTLSQDPVSKQRFREGLELVKKGVEANPAAHFNRERWEVVFGEFLLACAERADGLKEVDCLGNRLNFSIEDILDREANWATTEYGRPYDTDFSRDRVRYDLPEFFEPNVKLDDPERWPLLSPIRKHVTAIGGDVSNQRGTIPFDEPMLAIVGLWRQQTGANPHFALAIGETMLRVGQRYIAWTAFERTHLLAGQFSPDAGLQEFLRDHCRKRQARIEETLTYVSPNRRRAWQNVGAPIASESVAGFRSQFEAELAYGQAYQREYQAFEERKIAAGDSIADGHFYDEFHAGREPIASRIGDEEWFYWVSSVKRSKYVLLRMWSWGVFNAGAMALLMAGFLRWRRARASRTS